MPEAKHDLDLMLREMDDAVAEFEAVTEDFRLKSSLIAMWANNLALEPSIRGTGRNLRSVQCPDLVTLEERGFLAGSRYASLAYQWFKNVTLYNRLQGAIQESDEIDEQSPVVVGMLQAANEAHAAVGGILELLRSRRGEVLAKLEDASRPAPLPPANVFRKVGGAWNIRYDGGDLFALPDQVGLFYVGYMIDRQGKEFQPQELDDANAAQKIDTTRRTAQGARQQVDGSGDDEQQGKHEQSSDDGTMPDDAALAAWYQRCKEINLELETAREDHDEAAIDRLYKDREVLEKQISAVMGPDGRPRQRSEASRKTRNRVRKALTEAMAKISNVDEQLGRHLRNAIPLDRAMFSYKPEPPVSWNT